MKIIEMAIFALVTSASPGPVNILASIYGTQYGLKRSVLYVLGATIGFCTILAITGFGVGQLLQTDKIGIYSYNNRIFIFIVSIL